MVERALADARGLDRLHALIVARDGEVLVEERLRGPGLDTPVNIKSASKSVLSALAGIAIGQGVLEGVDQPIAPVLRGRPAGRRRIRGCADHRRASAVDAGRAGAHLGRPLRRAG